MCSDFVCHYYIRMDWPTSDGVPKMMYGTCCQCGHMPVKWYRCGSVHLEMSEPTPDPHVPTGENASPEMSRILVVDDETSIVRFLKEVLEEAGYQVTPASTTHEAMGHLAAAAFDLLITDILMPGSDGLELARFTAGKYDTDIILMTGYAEEFTYELAVEHGATDFLVKPLRPRETVLRVKRVLRERALKKDRESMIRSLEEMAITDALTGLYNSRHFYGRIEIEVSSAGRYGTPLSLLMLDIDDFKEYNDTFGHLEGDGVLVRIGDVFRECLRKSDSAYRYGGEEFALILSRTHTPEAVAVAHRIREEIEASELSPRPGHSMRITASIGVAEHRPGESAADFIRRADQALYESKRQGKNRVSISRK